MAIVKEIIIKADTSDAVKNVDALSESVTDVGESAETSAGKIKDIGESSKKASKGTKSLATGFKAVGTAFKAIGIGLIVALFAKLTEVLSKNQKVMDIFSNVRSNCYECAYSYFLRFPAHLLQMFH